MTATLLVLFWASAALVAYAYAGFPLLVLLRAAVRRKPFRTAEVTPRVSVVIAARNEAAAIGAKIDNLLALDYPKARLEVIVASDGSTDGTVEIARRHGGDRVRVLPLDRVGKAAALEAAVAAATGDILVFSDANSMFASGSLRALVRPFADPAVGGVAGDQRYVGKGADAAAQGERGYWSFDRLLKVAESRAGNTISATGAIYAIRKRLFHGIVPGVTDDFYTSTGVIAQGARLVFAPDAIAFEPVAKSAGREFGRKVRIITRGLRGVVERRALLNPLRFGFYSLQLLSHKVLRRAVVVPLAIVAVVSPLLWSAGPLYQAATAGQAAFYGLGLIGLALSGTRLGRAKLFALPSFFLMVNAASAIAMRNVLTGRRVDRWEPAREPAAPEPPVTPAPTAPGPEAPGPEAPGSVAPAADTAEPPETPAGRPHAPEPPARGRQRESAPEPLGLVRAEANGWQPPGRASIAVAVPARRSSMRMPLTVPKAIALTGGLIIAQWMGVLAGIDPLLSLLLAAAAAVVLALLVNPDVATLGAIALIYSNAPVVAVKFHGVPPAVAFLVPAMFLAPLVYHLTARRERLLAMPALPYMLAFVTVQIIGTIFAENTERAMTDLIVSVFEGIGLAFLVSNVVRTKETLRLVIWVLVVVGALIGALSFLQQVTGSFDKNFGGFAQVGGGFFRTDEGTVFEGEQPRLAGPIGEKNRFGQIMLVLVPLGLLRIWGERRRLMKVLAAGCAGLAAIGMALSFSRGAALGFVLLIVLATAFGYIKPRQLVGMGLIAVFVLAALPQYTTRLTTIASATSALSGGGAGGADGAIKGRITENLAALLVFADHPIVGVGPGNFPVHYAEYAEQVGIRIQTGFRESHNLYLGIAAETGIVGFLFFVAVALVTIRGLSEARRRLRTADPDLANMATALILALIAYFTTGVFLHFAFVRYFWLLIGLAGAAALIAERTPVAPTPTDR